MESSEIYVVLEEWEGGEADIVAAFLTREDAVNWLRNEFIPSYDSMGIDTPIEVYDGYWKYMNGVVCTVKTKLYAPAIKIEDGGQKV